MKVTLFIPCFVDMCYPQVGISIVQILERLGHRVDYPEELTCCGQPAFNSGYWNEARPVALRVLNRLKDAEAVVIASGSCGAMITKFYPDLFAKTAQSGIATALAAKCYEFSDFLVTKLGVTELGACFPHRVTFHDGCHGLRELGNKKQPREL
ncbi:MAG: (Fe-S)-binding protein, partial [Terrimicrobiaceae bacterium]